MSIHSLRQARLDTSRETLTSSEHQVVNNFEDRWAISVSELLLADVVGEARLLTYSSELIQIVIHLTNIMAVTLDIGGKERCLVGPLS